MKREIAVLVVVVFLVYGCSLDSFVIYHPTKVDRYKFEQNVFSLHVNGVTIYGAYFPPTVSNELNKVTVILFHGNAGSMNDFLSVASVFRNIGFNFFVFDYRGYGKSSGVPSEEGLYMDAKAVVDYVYSLPQLDKNNVFYVGYSLGAAVAIETALSRKPKGLVIVGGFTSVDDLVKHYTKILPKSWILRSRFNNFSKISKVGVPILFLHGMNDDTIPLWMSYSNYSVAKDPKKLVIFPRTKHSDIFLRPMFYSEIRNFIVSSTN